MKCREIYKEENEAVAERFELSMGRIREICTEEMEDKNFEAYFKKTAKFICHIEELVEKVSKLSLFFSFSLHSQQMRQTAMQINLAH